MKAAVMRGVGQPLTIEEVDVARPVGREVLVRVAATGVCHSDLHIIEGLYPGDFPCILGHESAGVVEEVGDQVSYFSPGDHVISCLSVFCGHCEACVTGHLVNCERPQDVNRRPGEAPRLSQNGEVVHQFYNLSSFAEYMLVHEHAIVKIRKDMPLDRAALIGCGVTHRRRRGAQHREDRGRQHGGGDRARRRRAFRRQRGRNIGRGAHHRHRHRGLEAQSRPALRSDRRGRRFPGRPGRGGAENDGDRSALLLRGHRPQARRASRRSRCFGLAVPPP